MEEDHEKIHTLNKCTLESQAEAPPKFDFLPALLWMPMD